MTKALNHVLYGIGVLLMGWAEFGDTILPMIPAKWRHVVTVAVAVLMWVKSHRNLFVNPDGTPASESYKPAEKSNG